MTLKIHVFDRVSLNKVLRAFKQVLSSAKKIIQDKIVQPLQDYISKANSVLAPPSRIKNLIDRLKKGGTK
jgi:hypothetical protein